MKKSALFFCFLFTLASCEKEEHISMRTEMISEGKFRMTRLFSSTKITNQPDADWDYYSYLPTCQTDDLYSFDADKNITRDEGGSKCHDTLPQSYNYGKWKFEEADTKLKIEVNDGIHTLYDITMFNDTVLALEHVEKRGPDSVITTSLRFSRVK